MPAEREGPAARRSLPLDLLEALRDLDRDMSVKEAVALLYVAENDGISLSELRWIMRDTPSTVSRIVARLGGGLAGRPGLGLLTLSSWPSDSRVRCLHLTEAARTLLDGVWQRGDGALWWNGRSPPVRAARRLG